MKTVLFVSRWDVRLKFDGLVKSQKAPVIVIPVKLVLDLIGERESRKFNCLWTPAFAGVTALETFYDFVKFESSKYSMYGCLSRCI